MNIIYHRLTSLCSAYKKNVSSSTKNQITISREASLNVCPGLGTVGNGGRDLVLL